MRAALPPRRRPIEGAGLNILLLTSEFAPAMGGIGTYACEIAAAASRLGAEVTVMAPDYAQQTDEADRSLPFEVVRFPGGLHSMRDLPRKILLARRSVRGRSYDVVHAADWPFFVPLALSRWRTPARVLMTVHGTEINETQTPLKRMAIRGAGVFGPRTEVVANSRFTETLFRERFSVKSGKISAINLGVSEFWFGGRRKRREVRLGYRLPEDRVVMITVARITRRKGHHVTLAALAKLPDNVRSRITWLVIGPDGEADYVAELRRSAAQVACDIRFLGAQTNEDIRDLYTASDLFCLTGLPDMTGRVEGFGLVYLEAGAAGLPSVASEVGGVPDAVLADETGILVPPSVESISEAIAELASDRGLRAILGAGASAHARALSWERCAATTYGLAYAGKRASAGSAVGLSA
jgi:glycosyltransferase involved in cell wall biosynthesis